MAKSFDDAQRVINGDLDFGQIICDPFPTFDKETLIGAAVGLLVAASPLGGLVGRAVGGVVAGVAAAKLAKKFFIMKEKDTE